LTPRYFTPLFQPFGFFLVLALALPSLVGVLVLPSFRCCENR
jgi:hypothetical protein